jgi:hypothetical protein
MIGIDATALAYAAFGATGEHLELVRSDEPLVLERLVNARGIAQTADGNNLVGIDIAGAGQGAQFLVSMLFSEDDTPNLGQFVDVDDPEATAGLRAFFYTGETPVEIARNYALAHARAVAFAENYEGSRHSWQLAGANSGRVYVGMFLVNRVLPQ